MTLSILAGGEVDTSFDTHCSGRRGKEVFGEVAALAALLSLCRLSCLLLPLPLSFLLCNLDGGKDQSIVVVTKVSIRL